MIGFRNNLSTSFMNLVDKFHITAIEQIRHCRVSNFFSRCCLCKTSSTRNQLICHACVEDIRFQSHACAACSLPLTDTRKHRCSDCEKDSPSYDACIAASVFCFPVKTIIRQFKYEKKRYLNIALSHLLDIAVSQHQTALQIDLVTCVPMHPNKLKLRGYNPSQLLAETLAHRRGIQFRSDLIFKTKETDAQASLSRRQRQRNLKSSFTVNNSTNIQGKHILLVDDVMTTGSTVELNAQLLKKAGAKSVTIACVARTPKK